MGFYFEEVAEADDIEGVLDGGKNLSFKRMKYNSKNLKVKAETI